MIAFLRRLAVSVGLLIVAAPLAAEELTKGASPPSAAHGKSEDTKPSTTPVRPLPVDATTTQVLSLASRKLDFKATAGSIQLSDDKGAPEADVCYIAYQLNAPDAHKRPVTFVFNGGPGAGSAWLQLGAVGPWRLPINSLSASSTPTVVDNEDTWLDFTDLVFIDPPGSGYSRIVAPGDDVRKKLWSVNGDIEALSVVVRRWLAENDRLASPKYILGESYGGFRGPRLAEELATKQGVGISGLVLISPALDLGADLADVTNPLPFAVRLPSYAAAFRERSGKVTRKDLEDVENYASHDYLLDFLRGPKDAAAVGRMAQHVSQLTGINEELVKQLGGRVDKDAFLREFDRQQGKVAAFYDVTISAYDPEPNKYRSRWLDPVVDGFDAPFSSAIMGIYNDRLGWKIDERYELLNEAVSHAWNWGSGLEPPRAIFALQRMLALDPNFKVLISHGLTDVQTPYLGTQLLLDQIPDYGPSGRVKLKVHGGGHMHYLRDKSRKALREDARQLIGRL